MPDLIRHPVSAWIALTIHFVPGIRRNGRCFNYIRICLGLIRLYRFIKWRL